jgi:alpha-galactosidase
MEEFKGTVANVMTADFWDEKLGEFEERMNSVTSKKKGKQKDGEDKYAELREKVNPLQKELDVLDEQKGKDRDRNKIEELKQKIQELVYTPEERDYIAKNKSNQGYHYMGSAKTYSRIGEALAKATLETGKKK